MPMRREDVDEGRDLEHEDHAHQRVLVERERVLDARHEAHVRRLEAAEERHHARKQHEMAEGRAGDRADHRQQHERHDQPPLVDIEPRRDELPHLPRHERRGQHDAAHQRQVDVEGEPFARPGVNQVVRARRQRREHRRQHDLAEPVRQHERHDHAGANGDAGADQPGAELLQMLQEAHPSFARLLLILFTFLFRMTPSRR